MTVAQRDARFCACGTQLSRYNPGNKCACCTEPEYEPAAAYIEMPRYDGKLCSSCGREFHAEKRRKNCDDCAPWSNGQGRRRMS